MLRLILYYLISVKQNHLLENVLYKIINLVRRIFRLKKKDNWVAKGKLDILLF